MLLELRTYDYAPLDAQRYLALFRAEGLPLITRHLPLVGYWLTEVGPLNRIEHLWVYDDLADRAARRGRFMSDTEWTEGFLPRGMALIRRQENRLLEVTSASGTFERACRDADRMHEAVTDGPLLGNSWIGLSIGSDPGAAGEDALVAARIVAGEGTGQGLTLRSSDDPADLGPAHEILRPAAFSPL